MGRKLSEKEISLHKKYIPYNIATCAVCLAAMLSLFFAPLIEVNIGKILGSEKTIEFVNEKIDGEIGDNVGEDSGINYGPVVSKIVQKVLSGAQGKLSISGYSAMKVALASGDEKADKALDELLFGENALVYNLIDSVVDTVSGMFDTDDGKALIEETLVSALITSIVQDSEGGKSLSASDVRNLTDILKDLEKVENGDATPVAENLIQELESITGSSLSDAEKERFTTEIQNMYKKTSDELDGGAVTFESIVSVAISSSVDLSKFDINKLLGDMLGNDGDDDKNDDSLSSAPLNDEAPEIEEPGEQGGEHGEEHGSDSDNDHEIVTTYGELLAQMGFDEEEKSQLKNNLRESLSKEVNKATEDYSEYFGYYGYLFYATLWFMFPWFVLFLFALLHIFAKNKRFTKWYVILLAWFPPLIWLGITLAPTIIAKVAPSAFAGSSGGIMQAAFAGITSFTWISGLCYLFVIFSAIWVSVIKKSINKQLAESEDNEEQNN